MVEKHGVYRCKCGRKLAGCNCPEHQGGPAIKVYDSCDFCQPRTRRDIKDTLDIEEKENG